MPFDPQLIRPEEPPLDAIGELQLPDDLAELATQLGDDAKHLAGLYPARLPGAADVGFVSASSDDASGRPAVGEIASELNAEESIHPACGFAGLEPSLTSTAAKPQVGSLPVRPSESTHIKRTSRRLVRALALVASLTALIASAPLWFPRDDADHTRHLASNPETTPAEPAATPDEPEPVAAAVPTLPVRPEVPAPAPPAPASRGMFLHEYSGPELEGLYDLIGEDEEDKISI